MSRKWGLKYDKPWRMRLTDNRYSLRYPHINWSNYFLDYVHQSPFDMSDYRQVPYAVNPSNRFGYFGKNPNAPTPPKPLTPPARPVLPFARQSPSPPWPATRSELRKRNQDVAASLQEQIEVEIDRERERQRLMNDYVIVEDDPNSSLIVPAEVFELPPLRPYTGFNFFSSELFFLFDFH